MTPLNPAWVVAGVAVLTLVGQVAGFLVLAKNHLAHLQTSLDRLVLRVEELNTRLARLEGWAERD